MDLAARRTCAVSARLVNVRSPNRWVFNHRGPSRDVERLLSLPVGFTLPVILARALPAETAHKLWQQRFPDARALFCAGSVVRGEHGVHSDLDIVVLFDSVPVAYRESLIFDGWPVEVFIQDLETLAYFVDQDVRGHRPTLASMLADAIVVPAPSVLSERVQRWARDILEAPPVVSSDALDNARYFISDLLDDLRDERPRPEVLATAARLYQLLGDFILMSNRRWTGSGKHLPRNLLQLSPPTARAFDEAFDAVFKNTDPQPLIAFAESVLKPFGGPLFDGYRSNAGADCRAPPPNLSSAASSRGESDGG